MLFENKGVYHPKEDDEIFIKNNDPEMKNWNQNGSLLRGDLIVRLK